MNTADPRITRWSAFRERWPASVLHEMTLDQYTQADHHAGLSGWVKFKTDGLGWRPKPGSAWSRIGICALPADPKLRDLAIETYRKRRRLSSVDVERGYCWHESIGSDVAASFESTKRRIIELAEAAQLGDLNVLKAPRLHVDYEWKLFFLYQDPDQPVLLPVQEQADVRSWHWNKHKEPLPASGASAAEASVLANQRLMNQRNGRPLFDYVDQLIGQPYSDDEESDPPESRSDEALPNLASNPMPALNQILYGPPGTGKTYSTIEAALEALDPVHLDKNRADRAALKSRFDALVYERRVRFVTFHQSFSYEDFVEGLRATTNEDTGQIRYEVVDGVFKSLCEAAAVKVTRPQEAATVATPYDIRGRRIWKMSLGNTLGSDAAVYDECIEKSCALLGYGGGVDFTGCTSRNDVLKRFIEQGLKVENPQTDYAVTSVAAFVTRMKLGDLMIISDGNFKFRAIGEVSGEYQFRLRSEFADEYTQMRAVKWLRTYEPSLPHGELMNNQFSQMTLYELRSGSIDLDKLQGLLNQASSRVPAASGFVPGPVTDSTYEIVRASADIVELRKPQGRTLSLGMSLLQELAQAVEAGQISIADIREKRVMEKLPNTSMDPFLVNGYNNVLAPLVAHLIGAAGSTDVIPTAPTQSDARVLIIDEINRGNISRIFGELITLIEPSKRAGASEALEVVLPYSKKPFSVPQNVFLIGTMNTADRSLTGMDVALRRRFVFKAMPPRPELLDGVEVEGIPIERLLAVLNQRVEALLDRDHCLGHAYFMPLREAPTLVKLAEIFSNQVLPLLQEYFIDDWQRIQWVLNDHRKPEAFQFVCARGVDVDELFGPDVNLAHSPKAWTVNDEAFQCVESYLGVIDHREAQDDE
ncbi:AAA family ATPase [Paucibacter sp. PLA-PC-4]|uniref:AAA family ATPase n=1 Tax=Paucibacter sp. PLA-PC-4 TaxID=2993655 RepID=UPI0022493597|nr:AAA family ATPase [Paucibacter sp. PLA-PC-4]MCX2862268.1 AAA family ATPase [Paucibacter sp. PLA-PC-4]